jgi:hypothetical protein
MLRTTPGATAIPSGTLVLSVENASALYEFDPINPLKQLYLAQNDIANAELVTYTSINVAANTVTLAAATTKNHGNLDYIHPFSWPDTMYLDRPLVKNHASGTTAEFFHPTWVASPELHDGRIYTSTQYLFQGPFIIDFNENIPRTAVTTLSENLAGPASLRATCIPGFTCIETDDASLWNAVGDFQVHIRGGGSDQVILTTEVVLQTAVSGVTLSGGVTIGGSTLTVASIATFPAAAQAPYGYRLILDAGTANAEVVEVSSVSAPGTITLSYPLTKNHSGGATVALLSDVIVLEDPLGFEFPGVIPKAQRLSVFPTVLTLNERVTHLHEVRTFIKVASTSGFTAGVDNVIISFGYSDLSEVVGYNDVGSTPTRLLIPDGVELEFAHASAEPVYLSGIKSHTTGDGTDHVFYLPSSVEDRLKYLLDRGRAAGVQITVVHHR